MSILTSAWKNKLIIKIPERYGYLAHGVTTFDTGTFNREAIMLYEHGEIIEMVQYNNNNNITTFATNDYECRFDNDGVKHGMECERINVISLLWYIEWKHGNVVDFKVNGDLTKSKLPKDILLPKILFSK